MEMMDDDNAMNARGNLNLFSAAQRMLSGARKVVPANEDERIMQFAESVGISEGDVMKRHSSMVEVFRRKVQEFRQGGAIIIIDRGQDLKDRKTLQKTLATFLYASLKDEEIRSFFSRIIEDAEDIQTMWNGRHGGHCMSYLHVNGRDKLAVVFPPPMADVIGARHFFGLPEKMRPGLFSHEETDLMRFYHEVHGHCTQDKSVQGFISPPVEQKANFELRADMAAIAGIMRDTGNVSAARLRIAQRDLGLLRGFYAGIHLTEGNAAYAHGSILRKTLTEIEAVGADFRNFSENRLVEFINVSFNRHKISADDLHHRMNVLSVAVKIAAEATKQQTTTVCRVKEYDRKTCIDSIAFLNQCADSLCCVFEVEPSRIWQKLEPTAARRLSTSLVPKP
ncbi:MAG TPA: hypothetical protein DCW68_06635 [Rhodospirillaceae bacterium]|nr:MAG: hypothetical protein A2018_01145 [Alphaproteobacteria bacterium GWF2_58_20]HAU29763.1 hypothetical protein [Rhodospirillaceae bacterium]